MKVVCTWSLARRLGNATPGAADNRMAYVLGLRELGHDVTLFEEVEPNECFDARGEPIGFERWPGRTQFERVARSYGVWPDACLLYDGGRGTHGLSYREARRRARDAALLLDVGVTLRNPELAEAIPCRIYVDEAPAKTQVFHETYGIDQGLDRHHVFFSVGLNVGSSDCDVPTCGKRWHGIVHPVTLSLWPACNGRPGERYTTISTLGAQETFLLDGRYSGEKADAWHEYAELPMRLERPLELALRARNGRGADADLLRAGGWRVTQARGLRTFADYRRYIASSRGEFSIANPRYVRFRTGWTSDRTARYLASGRPAVVESTGFEAYLPTGKGLLTFTTPDEAAAALEEVEADHAAHCRAARELAVEYFDARKVVARMLAEVGA